MSMSAIRPNREIAACATQKPVPSPASGRGGITSCDKERNFCLSPIRLRRHSRAHLWLAAALLALSPTLAAGATTDKPLPIQIEADQAQLNDRTGVSVYTGNVKVTRGELVLTGKRLVITREKNRRDYVATLTGSPAHLYQGVTEQVERPVTGTSQEIHYTTANQMVTLKGDAVLHRDKDLLRGDVIRYNVGTEQIVANSGESGDGRVHIIIHPQQNGAAQ